MYLQKAGPGLYVRMGILAQSMRTFWENAAITGWAFSHKENQDYLQDTGRKHKVYGEFA